MKKLRYKFAQWLRFKADRIDPEHAFKSTGMSFTFKRGIGIDFDKMGRQGCPLWYYAPDYDKAFDQKIRV